MSIIVTDPILDEILALQLTLAWAGEGMCEPPRLGWWRTDVIDPAGGGDLLARLLPETHAWASLQAAREAALRIDAAARAGMSDADRLRTLFFLGFEIDEKLSERLHHHKGSGNAPDKVLQFPVNLSTEFSRGELAAALRPSRDIGAHTVVPGGRQMKGTMPDSPSFLIQSLAAGLVPFSDTYPMPFYRMK